MRGFLALFCLLVTMKAGPHAEAATIRIASEGFYPPWNVIRDDGRLEGFEIDLAKDLCRRMDASCDFVSHRWDGLLTALTDGDYDVVMAGVPITEERAQMIDFSVCYAAEVAVFAVRPDNALAGTIAPTDKIDLNELSQGVKTALNALRQALAGTSVGVQIATTHADFAERYLGDLVEIDYFDTIDNLTLALDAGRIDAALSSRGYWKRLLEGENAKQLALIGPDMIGGVFGKGIGAGLRKEDDDLRIRLNQAIQAALADGTVSRLATRWFGYDLAC